MKSIALAFACVMVLSSTIARSASADADQVTLPEQPGMVAATLGVTESHAPAIETLRGFVAGVDQESDLISIRLSAGTTEQFRVQDGLIFDAVRFGDLVGLSVQSIDGVKTIVGFSEQ